MGAELQRTIRRLPSASTLKCSSSTTLSPDVIDRTSGHSSIPYRRPSGWKISQSDRSLDGIVRPS
jgi:hypothetical protein